MYINKIGGEIKFTAEKVLPESQPLEFKVAKNYPTPPSYQRCPTRASHLL